MLNNERVDRSHDTSVEVIRDVAKSITNEMRLRRISLELLEMAYQNQFEEDRRKIRNRIDEMIEESLSKNDAS
jgi:hypothetical protein